MSEFSILIHFFLPLYATIVHYGLRSTRHPNTLQIQHCSLSAPLQQTRILSCYIPTTCHFSISLSRHFSFSRRCDFTFIYPLNHLQYLGLLSVLVLPSYPYDYTCRIFKFIPTILSPLSHFYTSIIAMFLMNLSSLFSTAFRSYSNKSHHQYNHYVASLIVQIGSLIIAIIYAGYVIPSLPMDRMLCDAPSSYTDCMSSH